NGGPNVDLMVEWIAQMAARRGVNVDDGGRVAEFMRRTGLANVAVSVANLPMGTSAGRLGELVAIDYLGVCRAIGGFVVALGLSTPEQFEANLARMREDFKSPQLRCYGPFYIAIGQRAA